MAISHQKRSNLRRIPHLLSGFVILMHAYERFETGHGTWVFFAIAGLIFLSVAAFHHQLSKKYKYTDTVFVTIEAMLSFLICFEYYHKGKKMLPYLYLMAGLLQLFALAMIVRKKRKDLIP